MRGFLIGALFVGRERGKGPIGKIPGPSPDKSQENPGKIWKRTNPVLLFFFWCFGFLDVCLPVDFLGVLGCFLLTLEGF